MSEREKAFNDCARIGKELGEEFKKLFDSINTREDLDFARAHLTGNEITATVLTALWAGAGTVNPSKGIRQALEIAENVYEADNES